MTKRETKGKLQKPVRWYVTSSDTEGPEDDIGVYVSTRRGLMGESSTWPVCGFYVYRVREDPLKPGQSDWDNGDTYILPVTKTFIRKVQRAMKQYPEIFLRRRKPCIYWLEKGGKKVGE